MEYLEAEMHDESRLLTVLSLTGGAGVEVDGDCRYVNVWAHPGGLLARPPEELLGRTVAEVLGPEAAAPFEERIRRVLRTGQAEHWEYPLQVQQGLLWFSADALAPPAEGRPATVAFLIRDITARRELEGRLR